MDKLNEDKSEPFDKKSAIIAAYAAIKANGYEKKGHEEFYIKGKHGATGTKSFEYENSTSKVMKDVLKAQNGSNKGEPTSYAKDAISYLDDNFDECNKFFDTFSKYVDNLDEGNSDFNASVKTAFINGSSELGSDKFGVIAAAVNSCIKNEAFKAVNDANEKELNKKSFKPEDSEFLGQKGDKATVKVSSLLKKPNKTKTGNNIIEGYDETGNKFVLFVRDNDLPADLDSVKTVNGEIYGLSAPDGRWNDRKSTSLINVSFDKDISSLPKEGDVVTVDVADIKLDGPFESSFGGYNSEYYKVTFTGKDGSTYLMSTSESDKIQDMIDGIIPCKNFTCKVKSVKGDKVYLSSATFHAEGKSLRSLTSSAQIKAREEAAREEAARKAQEEADNKSRQETELKYGVKIDSYHRYTLPDFPEKQKDFSTSDTTEEVKKLDDGTVLVYSGNWARMSDYDAWGEGIHVYDAETGWDLLNVEYEYNNYRIKGMGKDAEAAFKYINSFEDAQEWNADVKALENKVKAEESANQVSDEVAKRIISRHDAKHVESSNELPEGAIMIGGCTEQSAYYDHCYTLYREKDKNNFYYTMNSYSIGD